MGALKVYSEPTSLVDVFTQCDAIEAWAGGCSSIAELKQSGNELAAMDEYLARTATEGRGRVAATMRRLEVRIGELLPVRQGERTDRLPDRDQEVAIDDHTKADFRRMAANPEIVEEAIAVSTDLQPASRRQVIRAIKATEDKPEPAEKSRVTTPAEVEQIRDMAATGSSSNQIAARLGRTAETVRDHAKRNDIEIPADAVVGRRQKVDQTKVFDDLVLETINVAFGVGLVDFDDLDPERIPGWVDSLSPSIRSLNQMLKRLKELSQ